MISGLNHLTIAVSDLDQSCRFYGDLLGIQIVARWDSGAYLQAGSLWLCLSLDNAVPAKDYTHFAFTVSDESIPAWRKKLIGAGVRLWRENRSEGSSVYFLDPDGHQLELHAGDLQSRLRAIEKQPYKGLQLFP